MVADVDDVDGTSKIEIRIYDNIPMNQWMAQLQDSIKDTPLNRVRLPGTHDSATYRFEKALGASPDSDLTQTIEDKLDKGRLLGKLNDFILDQIYERLCQCQKKSIHEQLSGGVRYLDLRVAYDEESNSFWYVRAGNNNAVEWSLFQ